MSEPTPGQMKLLELASSTSKTTMDKVLADARFEPMADCVKHQDLRVQVHGFFEAKRIVEDCRLDKNRNWTPALTPEGCLHNYGERWFEEISRFQMSPSDGAGIDSIRSYARCMAPLGVFDDFAIAETMWLAVVGSGEGEGLFPSPERWWRWENYLARWAHCGFPMLRLTDRQVAAFAMSDLSAEQLELARFPWPAWMLQFGEQGLRSGPDNYCLRCFCWRDVQEQIHIQLFGSNTILECAAGSIGGLLGELNDQTSNRLTDLDFRMVKTAVKILLHALSACADREEIKRRPQSKKKRKGRRADRHAARERPADFVLGTEVKIDARRWLADYLSGESNRLSKLRWLVRGHWRNQAYGPGRKLRKLRFIEPFWKGPEAAPTHVREHSLRDKP